MVKIYDAYYQLFLILKEKKSSEYLAIGFLTVIITFLNPVCLLMASKIKESMIATGIIILNILTLLFDYYGFFMLVNTLVFMYSVYVFVHNILPVYQDKKEEEAKNDYYLKDVVLYKLHKENDTAQTISDLKKM